jgi:thiosulfate/3-mercaptopyruvate sulfurtransferase
MPARSAVRPPTLPAPARVSVVTPDWLAARLALAELRVLDVRPPAIAARARSRASGPARGHVPGAIALDVRGALFDAFGDVVSAPELAVVMSRLGVGDEHTVVLVDEAPGHVLARAAAWALGRYGHHGVHVLDGGHARWVAERRPLVVGVERHRTASFTARVSAS